MYLRIFGTKGLLSQQVGSVMDGGPLAEVPWLRPVERAHTEATDRFWGWTDGGIPDD